MKTRNMILFSFFFHFIFTCWIKYL